MLVVVMYDITDDRRRNRLYKLMKSYGAHVQYSGFELQLDRKQILVLESEIKDLIEPQDSVRLYQLCRSCESSSKIIGVDKSEDFDIVF